MSVHLRAPARLGGAVIVLLAGGCAGREASRPAPDDPVPVVVLRAQPGAADALVLPARIAAGEEVVVTARIAGRVTALPRREGDRFRAGTPLAAFDAPEAREALGAARAALEAAAMRRDQAQLQEARMESLFTARIASQRERELAQSGRRDAEAALAAASAAHAELSAGFAVPAPFDGIVVRRMIDPGATVVPGQPLLAVRSRDPGEIVAAVPESDLGRLRGARFAFQVGDGPWREATLVRVDGMTDAATRTREARLRPAGSREALEPGAFARVRIERGARGPAGGDTASVARILSVPSRSLVRRGALAGVYVVREGRAHLRWLRLGAADGDRVAVLSGLDPGDEIAADPTGLVDGRTVTVTR